ncbi:MAG: flagellar biosynthesis protein FlgB [Planctomycetes bacterium]|nr:flagellar biosynthesis protein FlgB [Planctomycetota bacterium]
MAGRISLVEYLEAGLRAADLRERVIGNNIANLQTPGYRRRDVKFEEVLARALAAGGADPLAVKPEIVQPGDTPVDATGNDVDLNVEVGELVKNDMKAKVLLRTLAKLYDQMELAIRD